MLSTLPGPVVAVLLLSVLMTYPLARLLLWAYRKEVRRQMKEQGGAAPAAAGEATHPGLAVFEGSPAQLLREMRVAPRRVAALQGAVGLAVAIYLATLLLTAGGVPPAPVRLLIVTATLAWPGVLSVLLTAGVTRAQRWRMFAVAVAGYVACAVWASVAPAGTAIGDAAILWLTVNLPVTVVLGTFLVRRIRTVGPLVFLGAVVLISGAILVLQVLLQASGFTAPLARVLVVDIGVPPVLAIVGLMLAGLLVAVAVARRMLRLVVSAYVRRWISDDGIVLIALWSTYVLIFSVADLVWNEARYFALGLAAFPMYLMATWAGHRLIRPAGAVGAPTLLLLRVFADKGPTPDLFRALSRHWRHVGPMVMIGAWDLADVAVEPNDVMTYLGGKLPELFIRDAAGATRQLATTAPRRDPEGRYRYQQWFCFDDVWQPAVEGLIDASAIVLMDVRAMNARRPDDAVRTKKQGILIELEALPRRNAIDRAIVVYDGSRTVHSQLRDLGVDPSSVALLELSGNEAADVSVLLELIAARCLTTSTATRSAVTAGSTTAGVGAP